MLLLPNSHNNPIPPQPSIPSRPTPTTIHTHSGGNSTYNSGSQTYTLSGDQAGDIVLGAVTLSNGSEAVLWGSLHVTNGYDQLGSTVELSIISNGSVSTSARRRCST